MPGESPDDIVARQSCRAVRPAQVHQRRDGATARRRKAPRSTANIGMFSMPGERRAFPLDLWRESMRTACPFRLAGVVYDSALASSIAGQLDPKAQEIIANQPAFVLVDAANITVLEASAG